jgi:hypothetical protein
VLDAACRPGRFAIGPAPIGTRVTLADIEPTYLGESRVKLAEPGAIETGRHTLAVVRRS